MNVFISGSTGKVGKAWMRLAEASDDLQATALGGSAAYDFATDAGIDAILSSVADDKPGLLVLAAAMTNVDRCEREADRAMRANAEAVSRIAEACSESEVGLIFYSSDYVHDGSGPKSEEDAPAPLNVYGRSKAAAELAIREAGGEYLIVRINVPLARPEDGENFYSFVARNLLADKPVKIVTDQWGNPLDTGRIARWSLEAWQKGERGILHLGGGSYLTRFDAARMIATHLGKDPALVISINTEQLNQIARRPRRGGLLIARQSELFGTAPDLPTILRSL